MMPASKQTLLILCAWVVVMICATLQVAATHSHRELVAQWQVSEHQRLALEQDYGRLLLEKSALTAHGRVEKIAKRKLKMIEPIDVQVIRSSR
jgi:cell division protein FtsL